MIECLAVDVTTNISSYTEHKRALGQAFSSFFGCAGVRLMLTHSAVLKSAFHPAALLDHPSGSKQSSELRSNEESLDRWMQLIGSLTYYPRRVQIVHEDEAADRLYK